MINNIKHNHIIIKGEHKFDGRSHIQWNRDDNPVYFDSGSGKGLPMDVQGKGNNRAYQSNWRGGQKDSNHTQQSFNRVAYSQ